MAGRQNSIGQRRRGGSKRAGHSGHIGHIDGIGQGHVDGLPVTRRAFEWGYALTKEGDRPEQHRVVLERVCLAVAAGCFLSMAALWLWPGADFSLDLLGLKLVCSISLVLVGMAFAHYSERGLLREIQVDQQRQELRILWRNRKAETRLTTVIGFAEIGSVFLRRGAGPAQRSRLDLRYGRQGDVVTLFEGRESQLRDVWLHLNADLRAESSEIFPQNGAKFRAALTQRRA